MTKRYTTQQNKSAKLTQNTLVIKP